MVEIDFSRITESIHQNFVKFGEDLCKHLPAETLSTSIAIVKDQGELIYSITLSIYLRKWSKGVDKGLDSCIVFQKSPSSYGVSSVSRDVIFYSGDITGMHDGENILTLPELILPARLGDIEVSYLSFTLDKMMQKLPDCRRYLLQLITDN